MLSQKKDLIFYFDNEVLLLNKYLSSNRFVLLNARTSNGLIARNQFQWIIYLSPFLMINLFLYYFLALIYPIIYPPDCYTSEIIQDLPYYLYAVLAFLLEITLLANLSTIIAS